MRSAEPAPPADQAAGQPDEAGAGKAIDRHSVACHGRQGAGGKYPRIAALPAACIDKQLHDLKRRRINRPMLPIFGHHRCNDEVIATVAALPAPGFALWPYQSGPAVAAYPTHGAPPLIDQYPACVARQLRDCSTNQRRHPASTQCGALEPAEAEAVIDHLVELGKG